ncbi:acyltransferase family protein [Leclercia sp.]|uniref:acyltransferase family protein n=1 Tax=Leclercia sp. TaxID=1898428 RepID=UPI002FDD04D2
MSKINSIHYLRGTAAVLVVLYHLRGTLNDVYSQKDLGDLLFSFGAFGVDLFFIISGFIICFATNKYEANLGVNYIVRRIFRIYPLLIAGVTFYYIFVFESADLGFYLRSLIPLGHNISEGSPFFGYNMLTPAWTLTYEILFYFIFLIAMLINHRSRAVICVVMLVCLVFGIQYSQTGTVTMQGYNKNSFFEGSMLHAPLTILASPMFIDFIYGIIIYKIASLRIFDKSTTLNKFVYPLCVLLFGMSALMILSCQVYGHGPLIWGIWSAWLVLSLVMMERISRFKEIPIMNFFGDISYSLYLTHVIIIDAYHRNPDIFTLFQSTNGITKLMFLFFTSVFVAYVCHEIIEKKSIALGKYVINKINSKITKSIF